MITNGAGQAVWTWANDDPFGYNAPNENPSGLGTFTCNLRFPGQHFDRETNLHYNYFRDYDPGIGRYLESDPIGVAGGMNTYGYVRANPLRWADLKGLEVTAWSRPVDIGPGGIVGLIPGANHYWLKTDTYEAGMGPWDPNENGRVPGQEGRSDRPGDPTMTVDHTGESKRPNARKIPLPFPVNEACIDRCIKPGQPTGAWTFGNQCKTFVDDCLDRCRIRQPDPRWSCRVLGICR